MRVYLFVLWHFFWLCVAVILGVWAVVQILAGRHVFFFPLVAASAAFFKAQHALRTAWE